jgi:hypothetical protein
MSSIEIEHDQESDAVIMVQLEVEDDSTGNVVPLFQGIFRRPTFGWAILVATKSALVSSRTKTERPSSGK